MLVSSGQGLPAAKCYLRTVKAPTCCDLRHFVFMKFNLELEGGFWEG